MESEKKYPIKVVSNKTGLSLHVIRAWEKRYNVVQPRRTETNRRLYSEEDITRLSLLKKATGQGYSIGNIAGLSLSELQQMVEMVREGPSREVSAEHSADPAGFYKESLDAIFAFDANTFEKTLTRASVLLTQPVLIDKVVVPVVEQIGRLWRDGTLRIMHEHLATAIMKTFLSNLRSGYRPAPNAPGLIVTTPIGQLHELGALISALVAAAEGWDVTFLGANLPAEEIAAASITKKAKAVVLSIVYPADDPLLYHELGKIRKLVPENVQIIMGGRSAVHYKEAIDKIHAQLSTDLSDFRDRLQVIEK